jgi:GPH family glycoside/pentoside/hexuronide:cation symporter
MSQQQGYMIMGGVFGGLAALPFLLIFFVVHEEPTTQVSPEKGIPLGEILRTAWGNVPFRYATGIYMLNWIPFDLVGLMLPFYLAYWVSQGNLLASVNVFGGELALESVVFALLLVTAVVAIPLWTWLSHRYSKRSAYIIGMGFWAVVQMFIFFIQPGQTTLIMLMAVLAGLSVSTAHVLPDAIFPDVIEWDELRTGHRHEGIYYGTKNFIRKMTSALAIFFALQVLGWFGYQAPPEGVTQFQQSAVTLSAIRWLTGPAGAILLVSAISMAWFYPLNRERHGRIRSLLARRKERKLKRREATVRKEK